MYACLKASALHAKPFHGNTWTVRKGWLLNLGKIWALPSIASISRRCPPSCHVDRCLSARGCPDTKNNNSEWKSVASLLITVTLKCAFVTYRRQACMNAGTQAAPAAASLSIFSAPPGQRALLWPVEMAADRTMLKFSTTKQPWRAAHVL